MHAAGGQDDDAIHQTIEFPEAIILCKMGVSGYRCLFVSISLRLQHIAWS